MTTKSWGRHSGRVCTTEAFEVQIPNKKMIDDNQKKKGRYWGRKGQSGKGRETMKNWEMKREISAILIMCCLLHAMLRYPYHYIHHTFDLYALYTLTCFPHYTTKKK